MASLIDRINTLKEDIAGLEFQKEIFLHACTGTDIDEIVAELEARDTRIAGLQGRLHELIVALPEGTNLAIQDQQTRTQISSLPHEMLSGIFEKAPLPAGDRTKFAMSVSKVSRYWRETAIQTPFLWSGIHLFPWRNGGGYQKFLEILLHRSQSHPLDIAVRLHAYDNPYNNVKRMSTILQLAQESQTSVEDIAASLDWPESDHCLQAQLDIVIPKVARWRSFSYDCEYTDDVLEVMERLVDLSAPILESFDVSVSLYDEWGNERTSQSVFEGGAPMLSHVHIGRIEPAACLPPLSSVRSLHLKEGSDLMLGAAFLQILRSTPALMSLHLEGEIVEPADIRRLALRGENVNIATLRSFSFSAAESPKYYIESILNIIHCPALESLTISGFKSSSKGTQVLPLPPFPVLRSIKLVGIKCTKFVERFDFTHLPVLDTISLSDCTSPMALLHLLLPSQGSFNHDSVWPALTAIKLSHLGAEEFRGLSEIILHRRACGNPIKVVAFDPISLRKFPEEVEWMKQHVTVQRGEVVHYPLDFSDFPSFFSESTFRYYHNSALSFSPPNVILKQT